MTESASTLKSMKNQEAIANDNLAVNLEILRNVQEQNGWFLRIKDFLYKFETDFKQDQKEHKIVEIVGSVNTLSTPEISAEEKSKEETLKQVVANTSEVVKSLQATEALAIEFDKTQKVIADQNKVMVAVAQELLEAQKESKLQAQVKSNQKKDTEIVIKQEKGKNKKEKDETGGFFNSLKKLFSPIAFATALIAQFLPWLLIFGAVLLGMWDSFSAWMKVKIVFVLGLFAGLVAFWKTGILQNWAKEKALLLLEKSKMLALYALQWLNSKTIDSKKMKNLVIEHKSKMANTKLERKSIFANMKQNLKTFGFKMKSIAIDIGHSIKEFVLKIRTIVRDAAMRVVEFVRSIFNKNQEAVMDATEHSAGMLVILKKMAMDLITFGRDLLRIAYEATLAVAKFIKDMMVTVLKMVQAIAVFVADLLRVAFQIAATMMQYLLMAAAIILIVAVIAGIMILIVKVIAYLIKEIAAALMAIVTAIMPLIEAIIKPFITILIAVIATFTAMLAAYMTGVMVIMTTYVMGLIGIICIQMAIIGKLALALVTLFLGIAGLIAAVVLSMFGFGPKKNKEKKDDEKSGGVITWTYLNNIDKKLNIFESYLEKIVGYLQYGKLAEDKNNEQLEKVFAVQETNQTNTVNNKANIASYQMTDNAAPQIKEVNASKETKVGENSENDYSVIFEKMTDLLKTIAKNTKKEDKFWST